MGLGSTPATALYRGGSSSDIGRMLRNFLRIVPVEFPDA